MDFLKNLRNSHITYLSELPPKDIKVEIGATIVVPGEKRGQFNFYTWFGNDWVLTSTIDVPDFERKELEDACADLENAIKRLNKVSSNTENEELSSKLLKITNKVLQAKNELTDEVLEPSRDTEGLKWKKL